MIVVMRLTFIFSTATVLICEPRPLQVLYGEGEQETYFILPTNDHYIETHRQTGRYRFQTTREGRVNPLAVRMYDWATTDGNDDTVTKATVLKLDKEGLTEQFTADVNRDGQCFSNIKTEREISDSYEDEKLRTKAWKALDDLHKICQENKFLSLPQGELSDLPPGKYKGKMTGEVKEKVIIKKGELPDSVIGTEDKTKSFSDSHMIQLGGLIISQIRFHNSGGKTWKDLYLVLKASHKGAARALLPEHANRFGRDNMQEWTMSHRA